MIHINFKDKNLRNSLFMASCLRLTVWVSQGYLPFLRLQVFGWKNLSQCSNGKGLDCKYVRLYGLCSLCHHHSTLLL